MPPEQDALGAVFMIPLASQGILWIVAYPAEAVLYPEGCRTMPFRKIGRHRGSFCRTSDESDASHGAGGYQKQNTVGQ